MQRDGTDKWLGRLVASRYRLISRLGEGYMADVYLARHVLIDRLSAIKVLRENVGHDEALRALFLREARAVNRINHPNIVEISDYGETHDTAYLVMEFVPGEPMSRLLEKGSLGWERATRIGLQLSLALSRAHEMGVIHRDLKPGNVLLVPQRAGDDLVKLTDFAMAKLLWGAGQTAGAGTGLLLAHQSPGYVAPELRTPGALDARSDLFSLGVITYEAATGALPYTTDRPAEQQARPRPCAELLRGVPSALDEVLGQLLAPNPADRPRDAFEVAARFRQVLEDPGAELAREDREPPTVRKRARTTASPGSRMMTMSFDRIAPACDEAWALVRAGAVGVVRPGLLDDLRHAGELVGMVERLQLMVADDLRMLSTAEQHARRLNAEQGARHDALALARSKILGWAGSVAERGDFVRTQRVSGAYSVAATDALLWEEAALAREEDRTHERAAELLEATRALAFEQAAANERLERERATVTATLEGHVAALRALASEAWMALDGLAESLEVRLPAA